MRKPTAQKRFEGNPGRRPLGDDFEADGVPVKPSGLAPAAAAMWDFLVPELVAKGVAKRCDTPALVLMVEWWGRYHEASRLLKDDCGANEWQLLTIAAMATKHFEKVAARFGLTPSDRAGLKLKDSRPPDKLAEFLQRNTCSKR